jgi:hypothetical protein
MQVFRKGRGGLARIWLIRPEIDRKVILQEAAPD